VARASACRVATRGDVRSAGLHSRRCREVRLRIRSGSLDNGTHECVRYASASLNNGASRAAPMPLASGTR